MKKNVNAKQRQLHKKRRIIGSFLIFTAVVYCVGRPPEDILSFMISQVVPLLTYEEYFGIMENDYAMSYEVPEWFWEDEGEAPHNDNLAAMDNEDGTGAAMGGVSGSGVNGGIHVDGGENGVNGDNGSGVTGGNGGDGSKDGGNAAADEALNVISNKTIGTKYSREELANPDFLKSRIFSIDGNTSMTAEETAIENLLDVDLRISDLSNGPKVLIYHTHASESFADSRPGKSEDTVVGAGAYLTELLNDRYGIPTYHDDTAYDIIDGQLDRSKAYEKAYSGITKILNENPTIEVVIDLHRDGVDEDTHLVTEVNGKPTAKIMFLNGVSRSDMNGEIEYLQNPNKLTNLAFSFQMYLAGKEAYGDYVRKIYVRSLRYNLHVMPRAALIEAGAQNNTVEEEMNAMEPLAAMLYQVLRNPE